MIINIQITIPDEAQGGLLAVLGNVPALLAPLGLRPVVRVELEAVQAEAPKPAPAPAPLPSARGRLR